MPCLLAECVVAQERGHTSLTDSVESLVQQQIKSYNIPGLQISITRNQELVFSKSYGWADLEGQMPVSSETLFRIGSITKPISATAALMLAERQQLDLDSPVQRYCKSFPGKHWPVSTRELLAHTGGIRGFHSSGGLSPELLSETHYETLAESIALFQGDPLIAEPGTQYVYSNYGFDLVGCVLEGASGKRFDDLLQILIFSPAAMAATRVDDAARIIPHRSRSYTHAKDGTVRNARCIDSSNRIPAAGLLSTADDLARFVLALQSGKLVSAEQVHQMWTEQSLANGKVTGYGLGWMIHDHNGIKVVAHTGEEPGASTILCVLPGDAGSFAILANTDAAGLWKLADKLADLLAGTNSRR
jgi:CubicO group peptidase (beta-lactamase class C family)